MLDKSKIIDAVKSEMDSLHTKLDELKVKASLAKAELKDAAQPEIDRIGREMGKAKQRFTELLNTSGEASGDLKHGMSLALKSISKSVKEAAKRFK
jgi:hypothetical protein